MNVEERMAIVGVNGEGASTTGGRVIEVAWLFEGLETDFITVVEDAASACKGEVEEIVAAGFTSFLAEHEGALSQVEKHGTSIGENMRSSAFDAGRTDSDMAVDYENVDPNANVPYGQRPMENRPGVLDNALTQHNPPAPPPEVPWEGPGYNGPYAPGYDPSANQRENILD